jgi:hypothetical protein
MTGHPSSHPAPALVLALRTSEDLMHHVKAAREDGVFAAGPVTLLLISDGGLERLDRACRRLAAGLRWERGEIRLRVRTGPLVRAVRDLERERPILALHVAAEDPELPLLRARYEVVPFGAPVPA